MKFTKSPIYSLVVSGLILGVSGLLSAEGHNFFSLTAKKSWTLSLEYREKYGFENSDTLAASSRLNDTQASGQNSILHSRLFSGKYQTPITTFIWKKTQTVWRFRKPSCPEIEWPQDTNFLFGRPCELPLVILAKKMLDELIYDRNARAQERCPQPIFPPSFGPHRRIMP